MSIEKHRKHTKLIRPEFGAIQNNQLSIWGLKCSGLRNKALWLNELASNHSQLYIDQIHENALEEKAKNPSLSIASGFSEIVDPSSLSKASFNKTLSRYNVALFNGNHFNKENSLLFYRSDRIESILKRKEKINSVRLVLVDGEKIDEKINNLLASDVQVLDESDELEIKRWLNAYINQRVPELKALILAGGKSSRMGFDKSQIVYKTETHELHLKKMCEELGLKTYLSKNSEQEVKDNEEVILDKFIGLGPYGGILSAFQQDPNAAWLVMACDLPFIGTKEIENLISNRESGKIATAVKGKEKEFPEPLLSIWEPSAYSYLLDYLSQGYSCPRKVLINENVEVISLLDEKSIFNANTPEDLKKVKL